MTQGAFILFFLLVAVSSYPWITLSAGPSSSSSSQAAGGAGTASSSSTASASPGASAFRRAADNGVAGRGAAGVGPSIPLEPESCKYAVIGAGWGGTYFAWRISVDTDIWPVEELCIFEATDRVGGRAYSRGGIPGLADIQIDLGAYRFDSHAHPLVHHVMTSVLKLPTRCYDPRSGVCNPSGNLTTVADAQGNNAGYAHGPRGLVALIQKKGGQIFFNKRLTKIEDSRDEQRPLALTFSDNTVLTFAEVFLNLPARAIQYLDRSSLLFTAASEEAKVALDLPHEWPGAKQFLIYPKATWRAFPALRAGSFSNRTVHPPLEGRLHDFYGSCPTGTDLDGYQDCAGAVLTYYDFAVNNTPKDYADVNYFAGYANSTQDPYTYIPWDTRNATQKAMIEAAHQHFKDVLVSRNVAGFKVNSIGEPSGTVIALWWGRDEHSALRPGPSDLFATGKAQLSDPKHRLRNVISKPLPNYHLYIANEAFSGGDGWAQPSLMMTERIIHQHFQQKRPQWVGTTDCEDQNCFLAYSPAANCSDCVSRTWWKQEIAGEELTTPFFPNCLGRVDTDLVDTHMHQCEIITTQLKAISNEQCSDNVSLPHTGGKLSFSWFNSSYVQINFEMRKMDGWIGIGLGSMASGDMVIAVKFPNGTIGAEYYRSTGHYRPKLQTSSPVKILSANLTASGKHIAVSFLRPAQFPNAAVNLSTDGSADAVNVIYAYYKGEINISAPLPQHTFMSQLGVDFSCNANYTVAFEEDIKPLFREKDRAAMLFALDLYNYEDVKANQVDILNRLTAKAVLDLPTGMPKDVAWTLRNIQKFQRWIQGGSPQNRSANVGETQCYRNPATGQPPTFYQDIRPLFTSTDHDAMYARGLDLYDYTQVKDQAKSILDHLRTDMPCTGLWSANKIELFQNWSDCGFPEGEKTNTGDREVFYRVMNIEEDPNYFPTAKAALKDYLARARREGEMSVQRGEFLYRNFTPYDVDSFDQKMNDIYQEIAADADAYDAYSDPDFQSLDQVINRIIQLAPFNLVDGAWIARCCPTGPVDEVHSMLWGILDDEMGNGDLNRNHCKLYQDLLASLGISFPAIRTRAFAYDPRFLDSAFTQPAYALALAVFSQEFFPELLGTTLQLEWGVLALRKAVKKLQRWGINTDFFELHIGIDNAAAGHGYRVKRAVTIFLDNIRETQGEEGVQAAWRRIWDGYLAFDALGSLFEDLSAANQQLIRLKTNPAQEVIWMMMNKTTYGSQNHQAKRLGKLLINEQFANPSQFMSDLQYSAWVVAGNPDASPLMNYLTAFNGRPGPMFKVFTDAELDIWRRWILSLRSFEEPKGRVDSYTGMREVVRRVAKTAMAVEEHHRMQLWGPSTDPDPVLSDGAKPEIQQSVATWLDISFMNPDWLMSALKSPKNNLIVPYDSARSLFMTKVLNPANPMGKQFHRIAADRPGLTDLKHPSPLWTWAEIVARWIDDGCPMASLPEHTGQLFPEPGFPVSPQTKQAKPQAAHGLHKAKRKPWRSGRVFLH